jgi:hypothetical protein
MPSGVCPKCNWKAPAGLLKCPFCKTYIRKPGEGSSGENEVFERRPPPPPPVPVEPSSEVAIPIPPLDPKLPPPDPNVVRRVQREIARELFDDSDKWDVFEPPGGNGGAGSPPGSAATGDVDEDTDGAAKS